jgi:hypothetical protein
VASVVDICNLALSHLGNARRVAAIEPPDGSAEADLCASFFPIARDEMLEKADWSFARKRATLALLSENPSTVWQYAYAKPSDCLYPRRIPTGDMTKFERDSADFDVEGDIIYSNTVDAALIYTGPITDPTKFTPGFVTAMSYQLASYLAGPIIKGDEGIKASMNLRKAADNLALGAMTNDANKMSMDETPLPTALRARSGMDGSTTPSNSDYPYGSGYAVS